MNNLYPLVSVIIPTYKRPHLLIRAVDSVKNQTYKNIEIIVVDDANDPETIKKFNEDPEVRLLVNEENRGGCFSRNRGIEESKGVLINFLDDDDILYPTKINKQVDLFLNNTNNINNLGLITCHVVDGRSGKKIEKFNRLRGDIHKLLLSKFALSGIETVLYKKEAIVHVNGFDEEMISSQEYDLLIRVSEFYGIDYVDEILTEEFESDNQISINFDKKLAGAKQIFQKHKHRIRKNGIIFFITIILKYQLIYLKFLLAKVVGLGFYNRFLR